MESCKTNFKKEIRFDNISRSVISLQQLVITNEDCFKSFLTLTFKDEVFDIYEANKKFNSWRTSIKRRYPYLKYVGVPEFQKNGRVHYHLITNLIVGSEFLPNQLHEKNKFDVAFWNQGFSSAFPIKNINIVGYLTKYMTKDIDKRLFSHRRYFYSQNLKKPEIIYINTNNNEDLEYIFNTVVNCEEVYSSEYLNKYTKEKVLFKELKLKKN